MNDARTRNTLSRVVDPSQVPHARAAFIAVGLVFPVIVGFIGTIVALQWLPDVPDPAATHWSGLGAPDGFGPAWTFAVIIAAIGLGFPLLLAILVLPATRDGRWGGTVRILGAFIPAMVVFITVVMAHSLWIQRGLTDAADVRDDGLGFAIGIVAGVVVFLAAWFIQPKVLVVSGGTEPSAVIPLSADARGVWMRSVRTATPGLIAIGLGVLVAAGGAVLAATLAGQDASGDTQVVMWVLAGLAILLLALALMFLAYRVTVDASGLTVRGVLGWPVFRVPLTDLSEVRVTDVSPLADFGGWGVRWDGAGRFGIVVRRGEAIEIVRMNGKIFVVTVDDAERGAALLAGLKERGA